MIVPGKIECDGCREPITREQSGIVFTYPEAGYLETGYPRILFFHDKEPCWLRANKITPANTKRGPITEEHFKTAELLR
jgi:hypothetical protein